LEAAAALPQRVGEALKQGVREDLGLLEGEGLCNDISELTRDEYKQQIATYVLNLADVSLSSLAPANLPEQRADFCRWAWMLLKQ
jgi:hypothetical protein